MRGTLTDMKDVKDTPPQFELIPEGDYTVAIIEKEDRQSKNYDPMINIKMEITTGAQKGRVLFDNITIATDQTKPAWKIRWRVKQFLKAIGQPHNGDSFPWDSDDWISQECQVKIVHEIQTEGKNKGQKKSVIKQYLPMQSDIPF